MQGSFAGGRNPIQHCSGYAEKGTGIALNLALKTKTLLVTGSWLEAFGFLSDTWHSYFDALQATKQIRHLWKNKTKEH